MKQEDFNRLKAVCEKEGFELRNIQSIEGYDQDFTFIAKKRDIWEGVEFAECVNDKGGMPNILKSRIYKVIKGKTIDELEFIIAENNKPDGWSNNRNHFKPSTESEYFEQLKKEAFERFGDIKVGDGFDESSIDGYYYKCRIIDELEFYYFKELDLLTIGVVTIYRNGKWAEKVKGRVKVEIKSGSISTDLIKLEFKITGSERKPMYETHSFIRKQLEKYLNDEI